MSFLLIHETFLLLRAVLNENKTVTLGIYAPYNLLWIIISFSFGCLVTNSSIKEGVSPEANTIEHTLRSRSSMC